MSEPDHFIPGKLLVTASCKYTFGTKNTNLAREEIEAWSAESPENKYPVYFAIQLALMTGDLREARALLHKAVKLLPEEPLIISLEGVYNALNGSEGKALDCFTTACASPKSLGHAHHSYNQIACILALLERREAAFE
jgi:predicted Zn-dependent protease